MTAPLVLFDLDGVLVDSEPLMRYAFAEAYRRVGGKGAPPIERFLANTGGSLPRILTKLGLPVEMVAHFRAASMRRLDMSRVFPGVPELLADLARASVTMGIVTGKDAQRTAQVLQRFGLAGHFATVVCSDQVTEPKPHPESVHVAVRQAGGTLGGTVFVGDAASDIEAARRAPVRSIAVTWGVTRRDELCRCGPDLVVDDMAALRGALLAGTGPRDLLRVGEHRDVQPD